MKRRSTSAIIRRLLGVLGAVIAIHLATRAFYGLIADRYYGETFLDRFWGMDLKGDVMSMIMFHVVGAVIFGFLYGVGFLLVKLVKWIIFKPEDDPNACRDRKCRCTEHRGMVFDDENRRWYYDNSDIAIAAAAGAVAGAVVGGSIANS